MDKFDLGVFFLLWVGGFIGAWMFGKGFFSADRVSCLIVCVGLSLILPALWFEDRLRHRNLTRDAEVTHKKNLYQRVNPELLHKKPLPGTVVFGTDCRTKKYVCKPSEGSVLVAGGSGVGKSTCVLIPYLLNSKGETHNLVVDIKHELTDLCVVPTGDRGVGDGGNTLIFDPLDRETYGFDPFYNLSDDSSPQEVFESMQLIAQSIVPRSSASNDAFWCDQAAKMLRGLLTYLFKEKHIRTLPEMCEQILGKPIAETLKEALSEAAPSSTEYMDLIDYKPESADGDVGMAAETLYSIYTNLALKITTFCTDQNLHYCLAENPRKFSPKDLLDKSVMLCIPEHKLQQYGPTVFLIVNVVLQWILELPEHKDAPDRKQIGIIIDECVALLQGVGGELSMLPQALRVQRSKGSFLLICVQSISGLRCVMSKETVADVLSNLAWKVFLDSTTPEDQEMICKWAGQTLTDKKSLQSGKGTSSTRSVEYTDILAKSDLMLLGGTGECIVISGKAGEKGPYIRLRKVPAYKDKYYKPLLDAVEESKR